MSLTESNMLDLGTKAPDFSLLDTVSGEIRTLQDVKGEQGTIIIFSCNHCPFVLHVNSEMIALAHDYAAQGIKMVLISANDVEKYPMDSPDKMTILAKELAYPFPYLYDATQEAAKAYAAACTPDIYLFDSEDMLYYRGRLDGSRPGNGVALTGADIRAALDGLLAGQDAPADQYPSAGCNIKWK